MCQGTVPGENTDDRKGSRRGIEVRGPEVLQQSGLRFMWAHSILISFKGSNVLSFLVTPTATVDDALLWIFRVFGASFLEDFDCILPFTSAASSTSVRLQ